MPAPGRIQMFRRASPGGRSAADGGGRLVKACSHGLLTSSAVSLRFTFLGEGEGVVSKCFSLSAGPARGETAFLTVLRHWPQPTLII